MAILVLLLSLQDRGVKPIVAIDNPAVLVAAGKNNEPTGRFGIALGVTWRTRPIYFRGNGTREQPFRLWIRLVPCCYVIVTLSLPEE